MPLENDAEAAAAEKKLHALLEATADEIVIAHRGKPLTDIQRMILHESLAGTGYEKMEGYAPQHIKNEGNALWNLISEALGQKVGKKNFKGALENWRQAREVAKIPPALSVYNPETWVGRSTIIDELLPKLQDKTRLVWITGISGIGKTTLGECLASRAWESNPTFQWDHLEVSEGQGADFTTIAADLLAKLGDRELDPQERNDPKRLTDRLIRKLQSSCYWVQLDSLERLLNPELGTEFADAHWVTFLQRCLTERDFGSRLVLTAQALPNALGDFRYRYPNVWEAKTLAGLSANEPQNEHLEFFGKHGVAMDKENQVILSKLGQVYEGHTLVLQVMSGEIQSKDFGGDVAQYWAVNQQEFEQVARSLDAKRLDETEYNDELDRRVRDRVKKSLQQLPPDAQDLLLRSSVYRRPVPKKFWLAMIDDRSASQQKEAYRVLSDRALVERENSQNHNLIRQHNLICDIAYNLLRQTVGIWETSERKAAYLWLTAYEATPGDSNLATVRGYLEAFEHYCEIKDWDTAKTILLEQVGLKLHIWGEYREMLNSFQKLTGNVTALDEVKCKRIIGNAYYFLGDYALATEFYQQSLNLAREVGDLAGEGTALGNLGNTYEYLGQHERAIDCHQQHMKIAQKNGDREGESLALSNLGLVHNCLGQYEKAIEFHQLAVIISCEIGDQAGEGRALGNLGLAYDRLGQYERAIEFYQRDLNIASKIGDRRGEGITLANMGALQIRLRDYPESLTCILSALTIFREIGARNREVEALKNLTELYQKLGKVKVARQYCEQALVLATELGIPLADECRKLREEIENSISISSG